MASETAAQRAKDFLKISSQFRLGMLITESSHPVTAELSEVAKEDISEALGLLFKADEDVVRKYREWVESGSAERIKEVLLESLKRGGRIFFTGCGSTGRLSIQLNSIWRGFWQKNTVAEDWESRTVSVMAGGDFALIKSVEGFEDYAEFGGKQIEDMGVSESDVVFAITEGGETSFVIGTAWKALETGAKVYFVYNNPDSVLRENVERSRQVIDEPRIEKINLTTGPMAITGSTRMQATTIQLCVMLTVLEMVVRELLGQDSAAVPQEFLAKLEEMHAALMSKKVRNQLARLVDLEESVYRTNHKNNYFASHLGIDVLTDTTERSPTYCTPPFRKRDESEASESWAFLFLPYEDTPDAWRHIVKRDLSAVEWSEEEVRELVGDEKAPRLHEIVQRISRKEMLKFKIGLDGLKYRLPQPGDSAVAVLSEDDLPMLASSNSFFREQLESTHAAGARTGLIYFGSKSSLQRVGDFVDSWEADCESILVPVPKTDFLLDGVTRAGVKMLLNTLSTCTMVRLGRVMGNYMIYVVPSNLKLIDRSTRYISRLTGLSYEEACHLLFEVIEYVEPRMKSDQAYPPVVGMAVLRAKDGISNEEAEDWLDSSMV